MNPRIAADLALGDVFRTSTFPKTAHEQAKVVLLTGSTGFLGVSLLHDLLMRGDLDEIVCLVRAHDETEARARVIETLVAHAPSCKDHVERVRAVPGDVSKPRLGLSDSAFDWIARRVDTIFHCAAQVNLLYPYRHLRETNVLGTFEALKAGKTFHYISSLAVPVGSSPIDKASGYVQSKWVAEQLAGTASESGLPVCIYRPGVITGHSRTGMSNPRDALSLMLKACFQLRAAPNSGDRVHLTPVDYVSQAIYELSRRPNSADKVFALVNPKYISWNQIADIMAELGYIDRALPYREWLACLRQHARMSADISLGVLGDLLSDTPGDDLDTLKNHPAVPHLRCPDDDIALLTKQLKWLRKLD